MRGTPVFPTPEVRRHRAMQAIGGLHGHSWTRRINGRGFRATLSNQRLRRLHGMEVMTVEASAAVDGVVIYEEQINFPNPTLRERAGLGLRPVEAMESTVEQLVLISTAGFARPHLERNPDGSYRGDTLAVRSGTADGYVASSNSTFATMAAGSGLSANTTGTTTQIEWTLFIGTYNGRMFFMPFDTSSLGASAVITAAVFTFTAEGRAENDSNNYNAEVRYKSFGGTVTTGDWFDPRSGVWSGLPSGGLLDIGSWNQTDGAANNFSDSGVYTSIAKTGSTEVVLGMSGMDNATPTGTNRFDIYTADQTGTNSDPLLTITFTPVLMAPKDHHYRQMRAG